MDMSNTTNETAKTYKIDSAARSAAYDGRDARYHARRANARAMAQATGKSVTTCERILLLAPCVAGYLAEGIEGVFAAINEPMNDLSTTHGDVEYVWCRAMTAKYGPVGAIRKSDEDANGRPNAALIAAHPYVGSKMREAEEKLTAFLGIAND